LLSKRGIESYCPLNKVYRQWSDRRKQLSIPLFTSYVFVKVEEPELARVRSITSSIVSAVYWLGRPAVIKDAEIQEIKNFLNKHSTITLEKRPVDLNDEVLVMRGPFYNQHGIVQSVKNHSVVLSLPSLGYNMIAELDISNIQVVYTFNNEVDYKKHASLSLC
jgi:transcription antitermination factor NusG